MKKIQLSIPEPCHENWDNMTPTQQGRYCNACSKEVIDFSNMSDREVLNYFLKKKQLDKVCGHIYPDQLGRDITALPQKKKSWKWYYLFFAWLFMMKPAKTTAQRGKVVTLHTDNKITGTSVNATDSNLYTLLTGSVTDTAGNPVPFASINIKGTHKGVSADKEGRFDLIRESEDMCLEVSALGYKTVEIAVSGKHNVVVVLPKKENQLQEIAVVCTPATKGMLVGRLGGISVKGSIVIDKRTWRDSLLSIFPVFNPGIEIYPNPVPKGSSFTLSAKLKQPGDFTIQVIDAEGRILTVQRNNTAGKTWTGQLYAAASWSSGLYYIKLINERGMLLSTKSLVVE